MYAVSNQYKANIKNVDTREHYIQGTMTLTNGRVISLTTDDIVDGSLTLQNQCVNGGTLELGSVYIGSLSFSFYTDADRYSLFGAVINLSFYLKTSDAYEEVKLGVFTVTEAERTTKYVVISADDNMHMLDKPFISTGVSGTPYEILQYISSHTGIKAGMTESEVIKMPNGSAALTFPADTDCETYRDLVHHLSVILCGFATVDREGRLVIRQFVANPCDVVTEDERNNSLFSDFTVKYNCIEMTVDGEILQVFSIEDKGQTLTLDSSPFLTYGLREAKIKMLQNIIDCISKVEYVPSEIRHLSNPAYELGDMLEHKGIANTLIMSMSWTYGGQQDIKAVGRNPALAGARSKTDRQITNILNNSRNNINKVVCYTNGKKINIGMSVQKVFECYFLYSVESIPLFNSSIIIDVVKGGMFEVGYVLNGGTAAHKPVYQLPAGKTTLTLFFPVTDVSTSMNNSLSLIITSSDGEGSIAMGDAVCTLSGNGLVNSIEDWDGTLYIEESISSSKVENVEFTVSGIAESIDLVKFPIVDGSITERIGAVEVIMEEITVTGMKDSAGVRLEDK